ncbi:MAG TPA: threonyl-tRNA synthetase editing domain-containing protein, partial [Bacillales bacterium]|nr:threonyl-tRNA synthetase editing domain-containing protein [Bacillales bacterium]
MKVLQLHVDYVEYYPVNTEIKEAEPDIAKEKKRIEESVVILISIEKNDSDEPIISDFVKEVRDYLDKIKCDSVLLYPYSHLSSNLESPEIAYNLLRQIETQLRENLKNVKVTRAPFGWTKELNLKIKGHPLAENSKAFTKKEKGSTDSHPTTQNEGESSMTTSNALSAEDSLKSFWYILDNDGNLIPHEDFTYKKSDDNLKALLNYELLKKRTVDEQPPHVKLMRKLGIADYEPASDPGNMRFYPKGRLMKSLLEQ